MMFNQYGLLTRSNKSEVQDTIRDPEFGTLLHELYIQDGPAFLGELNGWCTTSSNNRCCFYMSLNYENKIYTQKNRKIPYVLPTYGVKGTDAISRDMKYVNQYIQRYETMLGGAFLDYVFGTDYVQHEEPQKLVSKSETVERLRRTVHKIPRKIEDTEQISRVMERIWAAREQDFKTRVLIVTDTAQQDPMELLCQLYLLMPQKLRIQTGFATNVAAADLDVISKNSLPIHIMTVERENLDHMSGAYLKSLNFPVEFVELSALSLYDCDSDRISLLKVHCEQTSELTELCMDYAERKVMEKKRQDYSSFRLYEEILCATYAPELYWWKQQELTTVEQICAAYEDQRELMEVPVIRSEALRSFYTERIPEGDFAGQIVTIVSDPQYPERERHLAFLRDELCYGKELDAIADYAKKRAQQQEEMRAQLLWEREELEKRLLAEKEEKLQEKDANFRTLERESERKLQAFQQESDDRIQKLTRESETKLQALAKEKDVQLQALAEEKAQQKNRLDQQLQALELQQREAQDSHAAAIRQMDERLQQLESEKEALQDECRTLQREVQDQHAQIEEAQKWEDTDGIGREYKAMKKELDDTKQGKRRVELVRNIGLAAAGVLGVICIVILAVSILKMNELQTKYEQLQSRQTSQSEKVVNVERPTEKTAAEPSETETKKQEGSGETSQESTDENAEKSVADAAGEKIKSEDEAAASQTNRRKTDGTLAGSGASAATEAALSAQSAEQTKTAEKTSVGTSESADTDGSATSRSQQATEKITQTEQGTSETRATEAVTESEIHVLN